MGWGAGNSGGHGDGTIRRILDTTLGMWLDQSLQCCYCLTNSSLQNSSEDNDRPPRPRRLLRRHRHRRHRCGHYYEH